MFSIFLSDYSKQFQFVLWLKMSDVEVNYEAKWVWDNEYYLSDLIISFKDPDTISLIASGESHHPSLERKPADEMVGEILDEIFH